MHFTRTDTRYIQGGGIIFLQNDHTVVELIEPVKNSAYYKSLAKRIGNGPYHICYEADDFASDIKRLENNGWLMIKPPEEAIAIDGRKVAFFYHEAAGMIELLE